MQNLLTKKDISTILNLNIRSLERYLSPSERLKYGVQTTEDKSVYVVNSLEGVCERRGLKFEMLSNPKNWIDKTVTKNKMDKLFEVIEKQNQRLKNKTQLSKLRMQL